MFVVLGMGRFSYGAMVPALVLSGQVSADQVGWVGGINLASFFVGAFISGSVFRNWRPKHLLGGAIVLSLVALLASAFPLGVVWLGTWRGRKCLPGVPVREPRWLRINSIIDFSCSCVLQ